MGVDSQRVATYYPTKCGITVAIDGSENDQINIRGLDNYQVPRSVGRPSQAGRPPGSDVEHSDSDSNDSDPSEASDSDPVVSFGQVIIDWLITLYIRLYLLIRPYFFRTKTLRSCLILQSCWPISTVEGIWHMTNSTKPSSPNSVINSS